jgi:hypothetical protein
LHWPAPGRILGAVLVVFMLVVAALGAGAYLLLFFSHVPGAKEERLGELEPLPEHLGRWVADPAPGPDGLLREQRHLLVEGGALGGERLVVQVRHRDPATREIVRVEPEVEQKRRRLRRG